MENTLKVLVVDDDKINRIVASKWLNKWGFSVDVAVNGKDAVDRITSNSYYIILMDLQLPIMDGFEATKFIRTKMQSPKNKIPIIAMSANDAKSEMETCIRTGMNDYISKPFDPTLLKNKITDLAQGYLLEEKDHHHELVVSTTSQRYTDLTMLKKMADGNEQFIKEFITLFLETAPASIISMQKALSEKDWVNLKNLAHKLKPSFNYLGIYQLTEATATIEHNIVKQNEMEIIPELVDQIVEISNFAFTELKKEIDYPVDDNA